VIAQNRQGPHQSRMRKSFEKLTRISHCDDPAIVAGLLAVAASIGGAVLVVVFAFSSS